MAKMYGNHLCKGQRLAQSALCCDHVMVSYPGLHLPICCVLETTSLSVGEIYDAIGYVSHGLVSSSYTVVYAINVALVTVQDTMVNYTTRACK